MLGIEFLQFLFFFLFIESCTETFPDLLILVILSSDVEFIGEPFLLQVLIVVILIIRDNGFQ